MLTMTFLGVGSAFAKRNYNANILYEYWAKEWDGPLPSSPPDDTLLVDFGVTGPLAIYALVVFPVQGYSLARIGLYEGLVRSNSVRATFMTIWKVGLLPWVLFIGLMVTWDAIRSQSRGVPNIGEQFAFASWAGAHLLPCGVFLAHASWRLHRNFRSLAAQSASPVWWRRWLRSASGTPRSSQSGRNCRRD